MIHETGFPTAQDCCGMWVVAPAPVDIRDLGQDCNEELRGRGLEARRQVKGQPRFRALRLIHIPMGWASLPKPTHLLCLTHLCPSQQGFNCYIRLRWAQPLDLESYGIR